MKRWLMWGTCLTLGGLQVSADPALLLPGEILSPGRGEVRLGYSILEYARRHGGSGSATDFAAGETRRLTAIPLLARYALAGKEEVVVRSTFLDASHRLPATAYGRTGIGDVLVLARSYANLWGDLRGALAIGVNVPLGRGVFDVAANELPSGDGTWDGVASFAWVDSRSSVLFHAEGTYFLRFPRTVSRVMGQALSEDVRIGFSHRIEGGIGMEMKATDSMTVLLEMTGRVGWGQAGVLAVTGGDAETETAAKGAPEFPLHYQESLWLTPMLRISATPNLKFTGGFSFPLRVTNGFSGTAFLGQVVTSF